jgi:hypothetical protein
MNAPPTPETDAAWACFKGYMEPLQDVQDLSRKLERERDEAREESIRFAALANLAHIHATGGCSYIELHKVTAQRDRLAEALQDLIESCNCIDSVDFMPVSMPEAFEKAQQALQSLTQKP